MRFSVFWFGIFLISLQNIREFCLIHCSVFGTIARILSLTKIISPLPKSELWWSVPHVRLYIMSLAIPMDCIEFCLLPQFKFFSPKKLVRLFILKEVKPSPDSRIIKLLTFDNLFPPLRHSRLKTPRRMATAISRFPAQMTLVHAWAILSIEKIPYS